MKEVYVKMIDWVFFNEKQIEKAVYAARVDTPKTPPVIGDRNKISDPTAQTALHNLTPLSSAIICGDELKFPELWLLVISKTYNWCARQSDCFEKAVRKKYRGEYYIKVCRELSISPPTFFNMIHRARMYAALQAVQLNLIHVD